MMLFELWLLHGRSSVCPICSGLLKIVDDENRHFYCYDCHSRFKVKSEGQTDKSLVVEQI